MATVNVRIGLIRASLVLPLEVETVVSCALLSSPLQPLHGLLVLSFLLGPRLVSHALNSAARKAASSDVRIVGRSFVLLTLDTLLLLAFLVFVSHRLFKVAIILFVHAVELLGGESLVHRFLWLAASV